MRRLHLCFALVAATSIGLGALAAPRLSVGAAGFHAPSAKKLFGAPWGIGIGGSGNVFVADAKRDQIVKLNGGGKVLARWGKLGTGSGEFNHPEGVALDKAGNVFVADTGNKRIVKLHPNGRPASWKQGTLLSNPVAVAVGGSGNVMVADSHFLIKFTPSGGLISSWNTGYNPNPNDGFINTAVGTTLDRAGNVYTAIQQTILCYKSCPENTYVEKRSSSGKLLSKWAFGGTFYGGKFYQNTYSGVGPSTYGYIFLMDLGHSRVVKLTPKGAWFANFNIPGLGGENLALDAKNYIYVADAAFDRVLKMAGNSGHIVQIWKWLRLAARS